MSDKVDYVIVAVAFHRTKPTHEELAEKVNEYMRNGYQPLGRPFEDEELMYQAVVKTLPSR